MNSSVKPKPLHELSVAEAGAAIRRGDLTAKELTEHILARIASIDPKLHSFILVTSQRAIADAEQADNDLRSGVDRGPLHGIPYALKDIYATAGIPTTCNSRLLIDHVPNEDATVEAKLKKGGAILVGKLTTHEFAIGGPSYDLPFPPARNPWNYAHFTGVSSSGSAAAVAAGLVRVALGTDTGGSIRSPAGHCGIVGLKPTYGLVSRRGAYPLSYSLDHCGPLTWNVEDAALVMEVIAGYDALDPSSVRVPVPDFASNIGQDIDRLKVGYARKFFAELDGVSTEVVRALDDAAEKFAELGAIVNEVALPDFDLFKACGRVIMTAEAYAIHEETLKTRPLEYGRYTYQRIVPGATLSAADITQAFRLRRELTKLLNNSVFNGYDALITSTGLSPAPRLDEFPLDWPPPPRAVAVQTVPFNVTGNPALAIPVGFSATGLPIGMQIVGRPMDEPTLFRLGAAFERGTGITHKRPPLGEPINA